MMLFGSATLNTNACSVLHTPYSVSSAFRTAGTESIGVLAV